LAFGNEAITELWNGTNWTEVNDLNTGRESLCGFGTSTATIAAAGNDGANVLNTELWNGTNWTNQDHMNTSRNRLPGAGTSTSGLAFFGEADSVSAATEEWHGDGLLQEIISSS